MALLQGGDPRESARRALPAAVRRRAAVEVHGRRVDRPRAARRLPVVARRPLTADVTADAGPDRLRRERRRRHVR